MNRNERKIAAIKMLESMVNEISEDVIWMVTPIEDDAGDIVLVEVEFTYGGTIHITVEGLPPMAIVRKIIEKAELG